MVARFLPKPVTFKEFDGLRNTTSPERLGLSDLWIAQNVDIDDTKRLSRRAGRVQRIAGATHSVWSDGLTCLAVRGTTLNQVVPNGPGSYGLQVLRDDLTAGLRMSYWSVNGTVYFANGEQTGVVQNNRARSWGLTPPAGQPGARAIGGYLPPGRYRYALTYLRDDGQESGTGLAATLNIDGTAGIGFIGIPVSDDPTVTRKALYLTTANGEELFRAMVIDNADTHAEYRNEGLDLNMPLRTLLGFPAPAGHLVSYFRGVTLVAVGPVLYPSQPYRHELFMLDKGFFMFPADINLIAPVEDGVFIGADRTYFMSGLSVDKWAQTVKAGYGAIPHSLAYRPADGAVLGEGLPGLVPMWASPRGDCMGTNGGGFQNLTQARYSYPGAQRGAGIVRQVKGSNQFLATLEGSGAAFNAF